MNIEDVIKELERFSSNILTLDSGLTEEKALLVFEQKHSFVLPTDYKTLLRKYNGVGLFGTEIYGVGNDNTSLENLFMFEHFEVENPMPLYLVPFSPDGGGNHYCFDTRFNDDISCPIVFWQHDYFYTEEDAPEITNHSLADWIKQVMIDWTLEDYNYDGTLK